MEDLVEKLLNSGNKVIEAAGRQLPRWKNLDHSKLGLETLLQFNIVHLRFRAKGKVVMQDAVCTSNTQFIQVFSKLKESEKKKVAKAKNRGIYTKDPKSILTFNLLENKYNTIMLDRWEVVCFLTLDPDDVLLVDEYVNNMLKRPILRDNDANGMKKSL